MVRRTALLAAATLPFCFAQVSDDFESGWDQTKWPTYANDCNQGGTVSLDTTTAHSGQNSIKVTSPGGYCGHIFFGTTAVPSGDVYVRVWVKASVALTSNHVSFITMPDTTTGKHLRIGGQSQILMYNRESDDATLPDLSPSGIAASTPLPTGAFQCFEYHLGTDGTIETWLNGNAISGLQAGPNAVNPYDDQWGAAYKPKVTGIYFGWESYGGDVNTMWYDDVSVGSSRVGCGSSVSSATTGPTSTTRSTSSTQTSTSSPTTTSKPTSTTSSATALQTKWGQCGGTGWTGPTACVAGSTCTYSNQYYSQCL
ncbi:hypothetical protein CONLIGDRAFT_697114 [Coniochaeta ligniaria NRRL 30616]|uniref:CBM1 domain-containing protein n=1 Tax=Coniochaeta ligniaria NRRL 30616 TaxID=1408157 RepID=A0A1J7JVU6_9PEZI|nr:hypothetical protein CONLIGDRAFT_697114 [Coniochaeta ligniaria NRRL 30616]